MLQAGEMINAAGSFRYGAVNKSILVCGCGRSGTSIMGRFIASHKNVEYCFDPPLIHRIVYLTDKMEIADWREVFETYLYMDIFTNQCAGRNLNFNRNDISYVYNFKDEDEVVARCGILAKRSEIPRIFQNHVLCFKVTDALLIIDFLKKLYPSMKILIMCRNVNDTVASLVEQKWFSDEVLAVKCEDRVLPMRKEGRLSVPLWLKSQDVDSWIQSNETERATMYYIALNSRVLESKNSAIVVNYDHMVADPTKVCARMGCVLDLETGAKTESIVSHIRATPRDNRDILLKCRTDLRVKALQISEALKSIMKTI